MALQPKIGVSILTVIILSLQLIEPGKNNNPNVGFSRIKSC